MATKQQIFVNNTLPTDKLLAGNGTDTLNEITLGTNLSFTGTTLNAAGGGGLIPLTTTFGNCENTLAETNIVDVIIPPNTLAVGDIINIEWYMQRQQNSATASVGLLGRVKINNLANWFNAAQGNQAKSSSIWHVKQRIRIFVYYKDETDLYLILWPTTPSSPTYETQMMALTLTSVNFGATEFANRGIIVKATGGTINISAQWLTADPLIYIRVQAAQAYIIKKAI